MTARTGRWRAVIGAAGLVSLSLFGLLVAAVHGPVPGPDRWWSSAAAGIRSPALDGVVEAVDVAFAPLLGWLTVLALVLVAARALWHRDWRRTAAVAGWLAGFVLVWRGVTATKALVDRPRPPGSRALEHVAGFSYPSGHVTAVASVGMLLVVMALCAGRYRAVAVSCAALATLVTGFDRVYLGVHFPTDVLGAVLGTAGLGLLVVAAVGPRAVCRTRRRAWGDGAGGGWDGR